MSELLTVALRSTALWASLIFEFIGLIIVLVGGLKSIIQLASTRMSFKEAQHKLVLMDSICLGLDFLLAGELLGTVTAESISHLVILASTFAVRAFMSLLIHFEQKQ